MRPMLPVILLAALSTLALAGERAVVVANHSGTTLRDHNPFTFLPGEVVTIRESREDTSLVESLSRDWATTGGVWVPSRLLARKRSFMPIGKWGGERQIDVVAGDYAADYYFKSNGAFTYRSYDERNRPYFVRGHLYQSKNILWARSGKNDIDPNEIFVVLPNGQLCWPVPVEDCGAAP